MITQSCNFESELPDVHARDCASDDEPLNLGGPLEDRVVLGGNVYFCWSEASFLDYSPTNCGAAPVSPHQRPTTPHVVGEGCAPGQRPSTMINMRNTDPQNLPAGPPQDRLWTEDDLSAYTGFRSVSELIARHPNFPSPVICEVFATRWCSCALTSLAVTRTDSVHESNPGVRILAGHEVPVGLAVKIPRSTLSSTRSPLEPVPVDARKNLDPAAPRAQPRDHAVRWFRSLRRSSTGRAP